MVVKLARFSKWMMAVLLVVLVVALGCSKLTSAKAAVDAKTFDSASAEVKEQWNTILSAAGTNGYTTAILTCRKLLTNQDLTPEQRDAINKTQTAVQDKMFDAAQKGNATAQQAVADIRKAWR
jgi:hypothetical protein